VSNQTEWRWADPAGQQRLVREDELRAALRAGVIPANAPVWTRGWSNWKPAHEVPELTGKIESTNGAGDVPPPPAFIVAAQNAFEGKPAPVPKGPAEPPPPPRYVPAAPSTQPQIPQALGSDTKVDAPVAPIASPKPAAVSPQRAAAATPSPKRVTPAKPPTKPQTKPPPLPTAAQAKKSIPPPLPPGARRPATRPPTKPPPPLPAAAQAKVTPAPPPAAARPVPPAQPAKPSFTHTQRPPAGVAPPPDDLPASGPTSGRSTLQVAPAPPPMPKLDPLPYEPPKEPSSKFPTLLMFDDEPSAQVAAAHAPEAPPKDDAPPSKVTGAVTRPPPWGEGAVAMDTTVPKSPPVPNVADTRPSDAPPRPMELSSSDLTSEARIAVVKAEPLSPAERPHGTMMGIGPDQLGENRAALERAIQSPPPPPLSASDVAATTKRVPPPEDALPKVAPPRPPASGAGLHDLRVLATTRLSRAADATRRGWGDLRERTKDKPPWFLPLLAGGSAFVLLILFAAGVKALFGSKGSATTTSASASASALAHPPATAANTTSVAAKPATPATVLPMTCATTGPARMVAPKALIASGVEVMAADGKIALGFASSPNEAMLETVDPSTAASVSAVHVRSAERVRRVISLDGAKPAVEVNDKGDPLLGRRVLPAPTPVDVGEMDNGLAWAPHGSQRATKLWPLPHADERIEALRGAALPNGKGFAVAFRHAGGIWFGAFGGTPPAPLGPLLHTEGLGPRVGSPAIATSGDQVMIAWADRGSDEHPWFIRYAFFRPGTAAVADRSFALPPGGLGEHAMSPSITSLGAGRFLLVWTEGPVSQHQVRGITFLGGDPTGAPFTASTDGVNAGQGQAAVLPDGRGVVAFLVGTDHGFEVHAAPIHCGEK
jgi:hypothetical protein